uniref:NADH-ubiquinone oxidoreductase chain 2 n=1 Tax=Hybosorus sp. HYB02 TaxID=1205558 RepID=A0A0S2MQT3_9SCAR|nr:NADH deshydrogenase subunit 2 [Hybosorus sp. HYB02]
MLKFYKILFFTSLITGTLISVSSYSWMGMWIGLEVNLLSIIPLMSSNKNMLTSEAAMKYFITQAMASTLLMFSMIMLSMNFIYNIQLNTYLLYIMNTSLLIKMGAAPFHFWFPEVMEGLSWENSTIMLTWQKIAPMVLIMYSNKTPFYLMFSIILSSIISGIMGVNQISLRKILAYSSINHIGWMLAAILFLESIWFFYFIIYTLITVSIILIFKTLNVFLLTQLFSSTLNNPTIKMSFMINFFSLGGLPPFLGFFPKWLTIQALIENGVYSMTIILIITTLMTLFFYVRLILSTFIIKTNEMNLINVPLINSTMIWMINFITLIGLMISTISFSMM